MSYFEMIGKYEEGYTDTKGRKSGFYFEIGFRFLFAEELALLTDKAKQILPKLIHKIYSDARCGMYHTGLTKSNIYLTDGEAQVIKFYENAIDINPQKLVQLIKTHFNHYIEQLKNPDNVILRQHFEKRFNFDSGLTKKLFEK
jgi:RIO-like serine/threonine protein kinase